MKKCRFNGGVHTQGVIVCLVSTWLFACAPKPVIPSGDARIPVNSEEIIGQYRERVKVDQRERLERNMLTRQVEALTTQLQELKAYVTLLQLQQNETEKGRPRQVRDSGAASPPLVSRATEKAVPKGTGWDAERIVAPPVAAVPREVVEPPSVPVGETKPTPDASDDVERVRTAVPLRRPTDRIVQLASVTGLPTPPSEAVPLALVREEAATAYRAPLLVNLGEREQLEVHSSTVIFRVSEGKGLSEFLPSAGMKSYLTKAIMLGQCIQVRGYTDGDEDVWFERHTARQRAEKARAYLIENGFSPLNIDVKVFPIGEHIADNATGEGRAKNRRVEIEVMDINPASIWPQWNG